MRSSVRRSTRGRTGSRMSNTSESRRIASAVMRSLHRSIGVPVLGRRYRWSSEVPWFGLFELAREVQEEVFAAVGSYELHADRQTVVAPGQWKRDCGLAGEVEGAGVGAVRHRACAGGQRCAWVDREESERWWGGRHGWRDEDVEAAGK